MSETLLVFVTSDAYRWLPLGLLAIAAIVAGRDRQRLSSATSQDVALAATILLGTLGLAIPFAWLADARAIPRELWSVAFERLVVVAALVTLGWAFLPRPISAAYQAALLAALAVAAAAFLVAAGAGQQPLLPPGTIGSRIAVAADLAAGGLAATFVWALRRARANTRGWLAPLLACQAAAACLQVALPLSLGAAVWWRLASLVAAVVLSAAAFGECAVLHEPGASAVGARGRGKAAPQASPAPLPEASSTRGSRSLESRPDAVPAVVSGPAIGPPAVPAVVAGPAIGPPAGPTPDGLPVAPSSLAGLGGEPQAATKIAEGRTPTEGGARADEEVGNQSAAVRVGEDALERIARFEAAMLDLPVGVLIADREGRTLFGNALAEHLLGRPIPAGRPVAECFPDPPLVDSVLGEWLSAAPPLDSGLSLQIGDRQLSLEIRRLVPPGGDTAGVLLLLSQRPAEEPSVPLHLLPGLADAIRTPMAKLAAYTELLARAARTGGESDRRLLGRIDANLDRMRLGLHNLLAVVTQPEDRSSGAMPADLSRHLTEAAERAEAQYREKGLVLNVAADDGVPDVAVHGEVVTTLLDNLLVNAAQRSPHGAEVSVQLLAATEAPGPPSVILVVRDSGQPPASDHQALALDHGPGDTTGLLVTRLLAQRHGCHAWVESDPPHTRFCVRFPVSPGKA